MFEILSSNIFSITLFFALTYWRMPIIRPTAAFVVPIQFMMMAWLMLASPAASVFPPTYDTLWLYVHVGFGKVFMGALVVAMALCTIVLGRYLPALNSRLAPLPNNASLIELAFRFMALGLVFQSLMLIAGAVWAQDAWGRYWDWDPLETWSFIAWIGTAMALHAKVTWKIPPIAACILVTIVFIISFLTFFGVPFISMTPHQGAV